LDNCTGTGHIGVFGDALKIYTVDKQKPLLKQLTKINKLGSTVGGGTENGIWIFFKDSLLQKRKYDNIFIYSDMQAGHGGLYGCDKIDEQFLIKTNGNHSDTKYIDVLELTSEYRKIVYSKVNMFSVQIAGYDNSVLPECIYRGAVLAGWTGKEVVYAHELISLWNDIEK
jgi:hypothetical protein